jgi:hypothetical protein
MDSKGKPSNLETSKLIVLIDRHLQSELELLGHLDDLNETLKKALEESGTRGLSPAQTNVLDQKVAAIAEMSREAKQKRQKLLGTINLHQPAELPPLSIRQFIETLDEVNSKRLESVRLTILDRLHEAHANLLGNQAVMFYSYEFYKRMVSGLLNSDIDTNQYSMKGQTATVKPGELFRKAI